MAKHKHADLIHAWADGAKIEIYINEIWRDFDDQVWSWHKDYEYRIKPEEKKPVVRWLWCDEKGHLTECLYETKPYNYPIKLEWSRTEFPE